jgi:hypothetical protein
MSQSVLLSLSFVASLLCVLPGGCCFSFDVSSVCCVQLVKSAQMKKSQILRKAPQKFGAAHTSLNSHH